MMLRVTLQSRPMLVLIMGLCICSKTSAELSETDIQSLGFYCSEKVASSILMNPDKVRYISKITPAYENEDYGLALEIFSTLEELGCQTSAYYAHYASLAYMIDDHSLGDRYLLKSIEISKSFTCVIDSGIFLETRGNHSGALQAYSVGLNQFSTLLNKGSYDLRDPLNIVRVNGSSDTYSRFDDTFLINGICLSQSLGESKLENNFLITLKSINHPFTKNIKESEGIGPILSQHCRLLESLRPN